MDPGAAAGTASGDGVATTRITDVAGGMDRDTARGAIGRTSSEARGAGPGEGTSAAPAVSAAGESG